MSLQTDLSALQERRRSAYVRFAQRPYVLGNEERHRQLQLVEFETRAAFREQNPSFAATLMRKDGQPVLQQTANIPLIPSGVHWEIDKTGNPGTITLTVNVSGASFVVRSTRRIPAFSPAVVSTPTRTTSTFPAVADALYQITLTAAGATLAVFYVPVARAAFLRLREQSRDLNFGFAYSKPRPSEDYLTRLALLKGANAAAQTGQTQLYARAMVAEGLVPTAPSPISPYTHA